MPIEPGGHWGETVAHREDLVPFHDEVDLGQFLSSSATERQVTVALTAGRFVDVTGGPHRDVTTMRRYRSDVLDYHACGRHARHGSTIGSISILTRSSSGKLGQIYVSNLGQFDGGVVSDRSHPNDGRFEVLDAHEGLAIRDLLTFRRRVRHGLAIDHQRIRRRSVDRAEWTDLRMWVSVDGARPFSCTKIAVSIRPDAAEIFVVSIPDRQ